MYLRRLPLQSGEREDAVRFQLQAHPRGSVRDEVRHGTRNAVYQGDEEESGEENEEVSKEEDVFNWIRSSLR